MYYFFLRTGFIVNFYWLLFIWQITFWIETSHMHRTSPLAVDFLGSQILVRGYSYQSTKSTTIIYNFFTFFIIFNKVIMHWNINQDNILIVYIQRNIEFIINEPFTNLKYNYWLYALRYNYRPLIIFLKILSW